MTALLTIARFEVMQRRGLLLGALVLGLVQVVVFTLDDANGAFACACLLGAVVVSWIVAFVTGMSLVGTPLHDGRLAFYFTRPINGFVIAAGKVAGGLAVVLATELVLTALIVVVRPVFASDVIDESWLYVISMAVVFLTAGLVVGIVARSRSRWFIADAMGATAAAVLAVATFGRINDVEDAAVKARWTPELARPLWEQAAAIVHWVELGAVVAALVAVVVAVGVGRTERERVHRTLSISLWSGAVATGLVGFALARWGLP